MRFFTTITPAGKAEYFVIAVLLNLGLAAVAIKIFQLDIRSGFEFGYAVDKVPVMAFVTAGYVALMIITSIRRTKAIDMGSAVAFLTVIPGIGQIVQLMLTASDGKKTASYTPYGDNPYDPNSWVKPGNSKGSGAPAVSFRGEALMLPGEERWDEEAA